MFSRVKNFMSRHKRKFIITGIVVGGGILAVRFAQRKIREFQENSANDLIEKAKRSVHFESTEQTCNATIISLSGTLCETIIKMNDTDAILEQIRSNPENKLELWDEMKVAAFTRITAVVYSTSMLVVTLRVQVNLLGGYLYKDTVSEESKISNELSQAYLSLVQFYLKDGVFRLYHLIEGSVRKILMNFNLGQKLKLSDVEQIFWSIQMAVNSDRAGPNSSLHKYMLPERCDGNQLLEKMFGETMDMLESDEVEQLCTNNVSRGFAQVIDSIAEYYSEPLRNGITELTPQQVLEEVAHSSKADLNKVMNLNEVEIALAKLIPILNGLGSKRFNNTVKPPSLSTSLVTLYLLSDKIKMLGANVYEVFSH